MREENPLLTSLTRPERPAQRAELHADTQAGQVTQAPLSSAHFFIIIIILSTSGCALYPGRSQGMLRRRTMS